MVDTVRSLAALQLLLADNVSEDISPQDVRDFLVSAYPGWRPATDGAYDDYFTANEAADWTTVTPTGDITWNYNYQLPAARGLLASFDDIAANDWSVYVKPLSGIAIGDKIQTELSAVKYADTVYCGAALVFTDGTANTSNMVAFGLLVDNAEDTKAYSAAGTVTNATVHTVNTVTGKAGFPSPRLHYKLVWSAANTFQGWVSLNGIQWARVGADLPATFTPTHGGLAVTNEGAGGSVGVQAQFLYFHSDVTP